MQLNSFEKVQFSVALPQLGVVLPNRKGNP